MPHDEGPALRDPRGKGWAVGDGLIRVVTSINSAPVFSLLIVMLVLILGATALYIYVDFANKEARAAIRLEDLTYQAQFDQLNQTEKNIKELLRFVALQKSQIRNAEDTILTLRLEQKTLEPLVTEGREVVDAIFKLQDARNQDKVWRERWIGFGFGIAASIIASIICSFGFRLFRSIRGA